MRTIKALIIATMSIFTSVIFKKKKRVQIHAKRQDHPVLFWFLELWFDVRQTASGEIWLNLKQRPKANYERGL